VNGLLLPIFISFMACSKSWTIIRTFKQSAQHIQ